MTLKPKFCFIALAEEIIIFTLDVKLSQGVVLHGRKPPSGCSSSLLPGQETPGSCMQPV